MMLQRQKNNCCRYQEVRLQVVARIILICGYRIGMGLHERYTSQRAICLITAGVRGGLLLSKTQYPHAVKSREYCFLTPRWHAYPLSFAQKEKSGRYGSGAILPLSMWRSSHPILVSKRTVERSASILPIYVRQHRPWEIIVVPSKW